MSKKHDLIRGAGGGGGGKGGGSSSSSHTPTESPDSLRSKQFARVLDLVSEGEIVGLVDGLKSVYLDNTPLQNADDSYNFQDVTLYDRVGTQAQSYIPGFPAVESVTSVGVEVKNSASVTRSISNANDTAVRVTISIPQLSYQNPTTGDLGGDTVSIAIDLQTNGGGYLEVLSDTISGKTTTTYQRDYRIELTGSGPWDVRIRRLTADSSEANRVNKVYWSSYTEIIDHLLRYPNSALIGLQIDAAQFRAVPTRGYHMQGLKVRVPLNYDPVSRTYIGPWDGAFKIEYTNNPAWCFYDMVTSDRYGLGEFIDESQIDKWALYSIGQYCDELVDDGFGGTEPRFTCNLYLQEQQEAYVVMQHMASVFRGMVYESGGFITAVQDAPSDPVMLFTPANVIDGLFGYSGSSIKARHTVALVSWNDPADRYRQKIEYVEDEEGIGRYGVRNTPVAAVGCTSRGQAHRVGKWLLYTERLETDTVTFKAGLDAAYLRPGEVIQIADPSVAGLRLGGRVVAATTTSVTVDDTLTLSSGQTYELSVALPDGTLATRTLNNAPGATAVLTFVDPLTTAPQTQSVWIVAEVGVVEPQTFRVLGVAETERHVHEIVAVAHNPSKYAAVESGIKLEVPPISAIDFSVQQPVASVTVTSNTEKRQDGTLKVTVLISWPAAISATSYLVELKRDNDNWETINGNTSALIASTEIAQEGAYTARVTAFNAIGTPSAPTLSSATQIYWVTLGPPNNLALLTPWTGPDVTLRWDAVDGAASYTVEVWDTSAIKRSVTGVTGTQFTYTLDMNQTDGGADRTLDFKVKAVGVSSESGFVTLAAVTNSQIAAAPTPSAAATIKAINVSCTKIVDTDLAGYVFYMSTTSGFTPSAGNILYDGPASLATADGLTPNVPYYFRVAAYDVFGQDNIVYSAEFSATPQTTAAETATETIDRINSALSDPNTADKLILVAEHFAVQSPSTLKYPFAISNVDGIDYVVLQADVIIDGNVSVANLTTGALPTDVQMLLGGGTIVMDGAGAISIYKALGANQDYLLLTAARLSFQKWVSGVGYVEYNTLRRRESGVANSGVVTNIPGYWNSMPEIQVSINSVRAFDATYAAQNQAWQCEYQSLEEYSPGQWRFTPIARLIIDATSGSTGVNISSGVIATNAWSSGTFTTPANATDATFNVSFSSSRGAGTSGTYYYRSVRWRVHYGANVTGWKTKVIGATLSSVSDSMAVTFGSAAAWSCYIEFEAFDTDGTTFNSGAVTYDYATDTVATITTQYVMGCGVCLIVPLNAYSPPSGWEIYQVEYKLDVSDKVGNNNGASDYIGCRTFGNNYTTPGYATSFETVTCTVSTSSYNQNYWYGCKNCGDSGTGNNTPGSMYCKNSRATVYRRKPQANTAIANQFTVSSYTWNLASVNTISSGALNWLAIGE